MPSQEGIQGVCLLLVRACGSRSPGRVRRLVAYMESRNIVVAATTCEESQATSDMQDLFVAG